MRGDEDQSEGDPIDEGLPMSDAERRMADRMAQHVIARILVLAQDKKVRTKIIASWGEDIDQAIGRGIRRFVLFLVGVLLAMAALRFGILERILKSMAGQ
jgi:hypothetical protein